MLGCWLGGSAGVVTQPLEEGGSQQMPARVGVGLEQRIHVFETGGALPRIEPRLWLGSVADALLRATDRHATLYFIIRTYLFVY